MWIGSSHSPPSLTSFQTSRVPSLGAAESRLKSASRSSPSSVLMVQGAESLPPSPNTKVRCRATGIFDRSGFGISVEGTLLGSVLAFIGITRNSRNSPTQGSLDLPERAWATERSRPGPVLMLAQVHHPDLLARCVTREIDDDIVAFRDTLFVQLG